MTPLYLKSEKQKMLEKYAICSKLSRIKAFLMGKSQNEVEKLKTL